MREKRRFAWLDAIESGQSTKDIARDNGVSQRTIQTATALARSEVTAWVESNRLLWPPRLILFFPINGFFPHSRCTHDVVSIPHDTTLCCAVCHKSGKDNHPALQRFARYDPRPDSRPNSTHHATRRQRRAVLSDQPERASRVSRAG